MNSFLENSHIVPAFMCHERTNCKKCKHAQLTKAFLWVPPISSTLSWWDLCSNSFFITIPQTARPYHDGSSVTPVLFKIKLKTHHLQILHIHNIGNNNHPVPLMSVRIIIIHYSLRSFLSVAFNHCALLFNLSRRVFSKYKIS
jgi:hypothetical protein